MIIQHNMSAANAERQLGIVGKDKSLAMEKLSTGYKINRAADNTAGLSISEKMRAQIRGLDRASTNTEDGMSLIQVADGALQEVHDILHRTRELAVQAANDINTLEDRKAIQREVDCLLAEIDRIADNTEFNKKKLFTGSQGFVLDANGRPVDVSQIPFSDFTLADMSLGNRSVINGTSGTRLNLTASTIGENAGLSWNLIYGSGGTSHSNVRMTYTNDAGDTVEIKKMLEEMEISDYSSDATEASRVFRFSDENGMGLDIRQRIRVGDNDGTSQFYSISYEITNTGTVEAKVDFLFNADTAYNNNDRCESYYINNDRVTKNCLYTDDSYYSGQSASYVYPADAVAWTNGFSIVDANEALPFSENIRWDAADKPDTISFGRWGNDTGKWGYYDNLNQYLGGNTKNQDSAFSFIWNRTVSGGGTTNMSFQYGIVATDQDANLTNVEKKYATAQTKHYGYKDLWIQSGANDGQGVNIQIGEMNTTVLGVTSLDVMSHQTAGDALNKVDDAIRAISEIRGRLGAQYNGLGYAKAVDDLTGENLQMSESTLRDADMADEMVRFTTANILEQAGISVLSQANRDRDSILQLLG